MLVASDFATKLTELRESAGLSQYALAKKAGVSKQAISLLEKGENEPNWTTVKKLARALGVSVADFDDEEKPAPRKKPKK